MTKPVEKTLPPAQRQIRPPPLSQHLREFAANRHAWAVLARNLIPVVGIYAFGWSAALSVFSYWFDGLTALMAIITAMIPRALRESQPPSPEASADAKLWRDKPARQVGQGAKLAGQFKAIVTGVVTWIFLVGIVGLPYWIVLIPLHPLLLGDEVRYQITHSAGLWFTFGSLAAGHFWKAFQSGYDAMPDDQLKQRVRWDVYLLVLRAVAMFIMAAHGLYFILVPLMALVLTYMEVWPQRVLGAVFGDPSRLWEYNPEKERKK
jgi:hypothetical protein